MDKKFKIYESGKLFYSNQEEAMTLANTSFIGELKNGKVVYSIFEIIYLLEKHKVEVYNIKNKKIELEHITKKLGKDHQSYIVYRDLKNKGNILKEGLKYGSDFRVYVSGNKPGKDHAKYLLYIISSNNKMKMKEFSAKARIAHSTKKILLLAIVDSEEDISYYEINWKS